MKRILIIALLLMASYVSAMELTIVNVSSKDFRVCWEDVGTSYTAYVSDSRRVLTKDLYKTYNGRNFITIPFPNSDQRYVVYMVSFANGVTNAVSNALTVTAKEDGMSYQEVLDTYNTKEFAYDGIVNAGDVVTQTAVANADVYITDLLFSGNATFAIEADGVVKGYISTKLRPVEAPFKIKEGETLTIRCTKGSTLNFSFKYHIIY